MSLRKKGESILKGSDFWSEELGDILTDNEEPQEEYDEVPAATPEPVAPVAEKEVPAEAQEPVPQEQSVADEPEYVAEKPKKEKRKKEKTRDKEEDPEAIRDVRQRGARYEPASWMSQMFSVARLEMRLSLKAFAPILLVIGLAVMYYLSSQGYIQRMMANVADISFLNPYGAGYASLLLILFPPILLYHVSRTAKIIPRDFGQKVAFINFTQPVSRSAYYMGKMLAGYVPTAVMIVASFCLAAILANDYGGVQTSILVRSISLALVGAFALTATVFFWSAGKNKAGTILPMFRLFLFIPLLYIVFTNIPTVMSMIPDIEQSTIDSVNDAVKGIAVYLFYLPQFTGDLALLWIDGSGVSVSFMGIYDLLSIYMFSNNMFYGAAGNVSRVAVYVVYVLWSVLFTFRGIRKFSRREL